MSSLILATLASSLPGITPVGPGAGVWVGVGSRLGAGLAPPNGGSHGTGGPCTPGGGEGTWPQAALDHSMFPRWSPFHTPMAVVMSEHYSVSGSMAHLSPMSQHSLSTTKSVIVHLRFPIFLFLFLCLSGVTCSLPFTRTHSSKAFSPSKAQLSKHSSSSNQEF